YLEIEKAFRLRHEADIDRYEYWRANPQIFHSYAAENLSNSTISTLRNIANGDENRLHKRALKTLSAHGLIKPFRKKWRVTPAGERALKYHAERDAFYTRRGNG